MRSVVHPVLLAVGSEFYARPSRLRGPCRKKALVRARFVAALLLRWLGYSYPEIGWELGGRDHSTIIHAVRCAMGDAQLRQVAVLLANRLGILIPEGGC